MLKAYCLQTAKWVQSGLEVVSRLVCFPIGEHLNQRAPIDGRQGSMRDQEIKCLVQAQVILKFKLQLTVPGAAWRALEIGHYNKHKQAQNSKLHFHARHSAYIPNLKGDHKCEIGMVNIFRGTECILRSSFEMVIWSLLIIHILITFLRTEICHLAF